MHTFINTTVLTMCQSEMFQPSKGLLQGIRRIDTFQQQGQQNELPNTDNDAENYLPYSLKMAL